MYQHQFIYFTYYLPVNLPVIQVSEVWKTYELELINYQTKCRLIRGWDDLFTKVKEHINSVAAMKLSPYYKVSGCFSYIFILYVFKLPASPTVPYNSMYKTHPKTCSQNICLY